MAVYIENPDGSLTLIKGDKTLADIIAENTATLEAQGLEVSPCVKDVLSLDIAPVVESPKSKTSTKEV